MTSHTLTSQPRSAADAAGHRPKVRLCGVEFDAVDEAECVARILGELDARRGGWVVTPNLDILRRLVRDAEFRAMTDEAELRVADGMPLVWASRLQGTPLPQRVAGSNLIVSLSRAAAGRGRSVFLLGGDEGTALAAAQILKEQSPGLIVGGTHCPPMGFEQQADEWAAIEQALRQTRADIVYVGLGSPKQERVIQRLRPLLPEAWWLGVGVSFSFLCGRVRRAPKWMQKAGLEWVHRLAQEPQRLIKRYVIDDIPFAVRLFTCAAAKRLRRRRPDER